jgi:hypothetical protein
VRGARDAKASYGGEVVLMGARVRMEAVVNFPSKGGVAFCVVGAHRLQIPHPPILAHDVPDS